MENMTHSKNRIGPKSTQLVRIKKLLKVWEIFLKIAAKPSVLSNCKPIFSCKATLALALSVHLSVCHTSLKAS